MSMWKVTLSKVVVEEEEHLYYDTLNEARAGARYLAETLDLNGAPMRCLSAAWHPRIGELLRITVKEVACLDSA